MHQSFGFAQDRPFGKHLVWEFWQRLDAATPDALPDIVAPYLADDVAWNGFHPFNQLDRREAVVGGWWQPLRAAFPDVRRDTYILLGGSFAGKDWVSATGCFVGTFADDWVGIRATGKQTHIRFGEFCAVKDGRIVEDYMLLDLVDLMRQSGYRVLPPSPGDETYWTRPFGAEGVLLSAQDDAESLRSLRLVEAMIGGLGKYDGTDAGKMGQTTFWSQQMHWYGPCGIGSSRNRKEYERNHQTPFLYAFPDRKGGNHKSRIAEGSFVASTGWPSVRATHLGEYLGCPATGKPIGMRVADWWRREGDVLVQNWVFIDLPDLFMQFGVDLFARLR